MRISLNWLSEYISIPFSPEELAHRLTMLGLEIEAIEHVGGRWDKVLVGEVLEVTPHPNADKLRLARVSIGNGEPLGIVCGAPNVRPGLKVAVATVGADLGEGLVIKQAKIRGASSEGMICSERELGVSERHEGIWELPGTVSVGVPLADALHLRDTVFEVGITPNRADCLSHIGVAREVRALTGEKIRFPDISISNTGGEITQHVKISLPQPDLCPRYVAKLVRNVTVRPSPDWLRRKLEAVGLRPINNVVDVTNFVLMECGHPLHAFDFDVVEGGEIVVRTAGGFAEEYVTLDSKKRKLPADALLITDGKTPLGIAGIMGGENSEIRETTRNVLIESAYFLPSSIRRTAKTLALSTDASYRFERGTNFDVLPGAATRAAELIADLAGGEIVDGMIDAYPDPLPHLDVRFRPQRVHAVLGMDIPASRMEEIMKRLDFEVERNDAGAIAVRVPSYRVDIEREEDIIEEIARVIGYEEIPTSPFERAPLTGRREALRPREFDLALRTTLLSVGATECISNPLVSKKHAHAFRPDPVELINPLNTERDRMRTSVAINLLEAARVNERFGSPGQRLFELGNVFHYTGHPEQLGHVRESTELGILLSGIQEPKTAYNTEAVKADIFLLRGMVESVLGRLGIRDAQVEQASAPLFLDPSEQLASSSNGRTLVRFGRLAHSIQKEFDLRNPVWIALFDHGALYDIARHLTEHPKPVAPLPKYPAVERDLAIVLASDIAAATAEKTIRS